MKSGDRRARSGAGPTIVLSLLLIAVQVTACSDAAEPGAFSVIATVASGEEPADGFSPGDPLAGALARVYDGDDVLVETTLDAAGSAELTVSPGSYTVQITTGDTGPGCFWGTTVSGVELPRDLLLEVTYICSGG